MNQTTRKQNALFDVCQSASVQYECYTVIRTTVMEIVGTKTCHFFSQKQITQMNIQS